MKFQNPSVHHLKVSNFTEKWNNQSKISKFCNFLRYLAHKIFKFCFQMHITQKRGITVI